LPPHAKVDAPRASTTRHADRPRECRQRASHPPASILVVRIALRCLVRRGTRKGRHGETRAFTLAAASMPGHGGEPRQLGAPSVDSRDAAPRDSEQLPVPFQR
jgi:hypothetical protein